jgi:hypothetical protein
MSPTIHYVSFLVRLWREETTDLSQQSTNWESEVEHIQTGDRWEFDTLDQMLAFLRREVGGAGALSTVVNDR